MDLDFSNPEVIRNGFAWIKQNLDPSRSYLIFENNVTPLGHTLFSESLRVYQNLKKEGYVWKKVYDPDLAREYLVIAIESGSEDRTFGKIMGYGFPENTVSYLYKAQQTKP